MIQMEPRRPLHEERQMGEKTLMKDSGRIPGGWDGGAVRPSSRDKSPMHRPP